MRKITMSIVSMIALSSLSFAGGKIVDPAPTEVLPIFADDSAFYIGLGLSGLSLRNDFTDEEFSSLGVMLQAGYQFNQYIAIEGRYTLSVGDVEYDHGTTLNSNYDDYPTDFTNIGIYAKGMYPIGDFVPYVLLGYGEVTLTDLPLGGAGISADRSESGFQWGLGAGYNFTENISGFVDYVRLYDDTGFDYRATTVDVASDVWTLGVSYKF